MCGICGFAGISKHSNEALPLLQAMTDSLAHRGPDGGNIWLDHEAGLGHRRLAIIDLNTGGQPMWDVTHQQVIVFNGEIYNYPELKNELEIKGYKFLTASDTEIIQAVIQEWGRNEGLLRLRGMFAFALYDTRTKTMLLARDRTGIKPLFWTVKDSVLYFASEVKALLQQGLVERSMDVASIHDYLAFGHAVTPRTCWREVHLLQPGSWMEFGPQGQRQGIYWQWTPHPEENVSEQMWLTRLEGTLSDSLRHHLLSDVPLGAFLSGGIDSSLAVALLASHHVNGLHTFNVSFEEQTFNESPYAKLVADQYQTYHEEIAVSSRNADPELLIQVMEQFDEPFGDTASLPNYMLSQATARNVKVVLSGDGGDEILGGYPFYKRLKQVERWNRLAWADPLVGPTLNALVGMRLPQATRLNKFWLNAKGGPSERLTMLSTLFTEVDRFKNYTLAFRELVAEQGATFTRIEPYVPVEVRDPLDRMFALEFRIRLNNGYLRKVDITSSAHGLETRVPFLDNDMLEWSQTVPSSMKIKAGQLKYLGYRLAEKYLPDQVVHRPKHGFNFPFDDWSRTPRIQAFLHDLLFAKEARWKEILQPNFIDEAWDVFSNQRQSPFLSRMGAYNRIYTLTSLETWLRKWKPSC
jgi:asparagine synthase (glutamine-hydrolysing)